MAVERELLTQKFGKAKLIFETGLDAFILKEIFGFFLGDPASGFTDGAIDAMVENWFINEVAEEGEVVQGDVRDIANKSVGMQRITLTEKNFYLFYKKGFRSKKQKVLALPLKYAKDVEIKGIVLKDVLISIEVPLKEQKKTAFQLSLRVFLPDVWLNTVKCAIAENSPDKTEEKIFGCIDINRTGKGRHGLYFAKDKVIVAKSMPSLLWLLVLVPLIGIGEFLLFFSILGFIADYGSEAQFLFTMGLPMSIVPVLLWQAANNRKHKKLLRLKPNDVLANNKKNFEIPYGQITQIELKKGRLGFRDKVKISTHNMNYQFGILNKKLFKYYTSLVRWTLPENKLVLPEIEERKLPKALQ